MLAVRDLPASPVAPDSPRGAFQPNSKPMVTRSLRSVFRIVPLRGFTVLIALFSAGFAQAAVKLANLDTAAIGSATVSAVNYKAQPFRTTASGPFEVTLVTLRMGAGSNGAGQFFLAIYSGATAPVSLVPNGLLSGSDNPVAAGTHTYTATGLTLDPNTTYWLVAGVRAGAGSYRWSIAANATYQTAEWAGVGQFGFSTTAGSAWSVEASSSPYQFSISNTAVGTFAFAGADDFNDNDLGAIGTGNRWRFQAQLAGNAGVFANRGGVLDFTAATAPPGIATRVLGWITPSSSGGSFGFDWVATLNVRNSALPSAGFTMAGFEVYSLYSDATGAVGSNAYYGVYLHNAAGNPATRVQAERGVWNPAAGDFVRSAVTTPLPSPGQRTAVLRLQWTAATRTLVAGYSADGRDFTTVRTFSVGGADAGRGAPWVGGFGLEIVGVTDRTAVAAGAMTYDDLVVTSSVPPAIYTQPAALTVAAGQSATLSVEVAGSRPLAYQWFKNDAAVAGATGASLRLLGAAVADAGVYRVTVSNSFGTVASASAALTVTTPLTITAQPQGATVAEGAGATFAVTAVTTPPAPIAYQWRRNGINVPGATGATLAVNPVTSASFGTYSVLLTSPLGSLESAPARLLPANVAAVPPAITQQPRGVTVNAGATVVLSVAATGTPAPGYVWKLNGTALPGATAATLVVTDTRAADSGVYTVTVANTAGEVTSDSAIVTVGEGFSRQLNISTRGFAGADADTLIPAFVIAGSNPKRLLIRAAGPALAALGVGGTLADPQLALVSNGTQVLTNDNWSADAANANAVRTAGAAVGAFPFADGSRDAAVVVTLPPGSGSILVTGVGGATGEAIVEVYDLDEADPVRSRLVNISTRARVPAGGNPLISGFVVQGAMSKAVLIRATGPALAAFGVAGALAQPRLTVFNEAGQAIAANTGWESGGIANAIIGASGSVGAFPLARGSADSAVLTVLPPGNYTAQVAGADGTGGVSLVEVYELP